MLNEIGSEFYILRQAPKEQLYECAGPCVAEGIERLRKGQVERIAGFDGEYGKIKLFDQAELDILNGQTALFQMAASKKPSEDIKHELKKKNISEPENKEDISKKAAPPNSEQSAAIKFTGRTLAVIAGPGTGKTRTLVSRIDYLINEIGVKPSERCV